MDGNRDEPETAHDLNREAGGLYDDVTPRSGGSFVTRHWRGDYPAGKAFLIGFFGAVVLAPAVLFATEEGTGFRLTALFLYTAIGLWGSVGMLRSGLRNVHSEPDLLRRQKGIRAITFGGMFAIGQLSSFVAVLVAPAAPPAQQVHHVDQ